jgi:hyaluronan synthase
MSRFSVGAYTYSSLIASLNGRFAPISRTNPTSIDRTVPYSGMGTKALIVMAVASVGFGTYTNWHDFENAIDTLRTCLFGVIYTRTGFLLLVINAVVLIWQISLALKYRPAPTCTDEQLPTCTVVVPAYNEGRMVLRTLRSIARSDYPAAKLQIIAIDDGSKDDTWLWILKAAREFPGIVTVQQPRNMGKKHAMYDGFKRASGDILVTIDSDSLIETGTIRRLVSPFYHDPEAGAVAGNVRVLNHHEGLIPRMLEVSFAYSFEFIRAAQSRIKTVFCTPGALAAYRRTALMPVLDEWLEQTFWGGPAKIGEDRALTNWVLRSGHDVLFQANAIVYTNVPTNYEGLCRMFLRWARSNVRETVMMNQFIFQKFRSSGALGARVNYVHSVINLLLPQFLLIGMLACILWKPAVFVMPILFGSAIGAMIPAVFYAIRRRSSDAIWSYAYSFFWVTSLFWVTPYSILTVQNDKWMTRDQKTAEPVMPTQPRAAA